MAFPARYKGTCKKCSAAIEVGQYITWDRTKKGSAYHFDCSNPSAIPATSSEIHSGDTISKLQETLDAAMAAIAEMKAEKTAAPLTPPFSSRVTCLHCGETRPVTQTHCEHCHPDTKSAPVTETALVKATPKATDVPKKHTLKDSAQWHEVLSAICSNFGDSLIRVLLIGPPGTGKSKTSLVLTSTPYRVTMTEGMGIEDLIGMYQLVKGETVWVDGPCVRAMREGKRILIDEIDHHPTEVGSLLYALLDDQPEIMLPTGEHVIAKAGYGVIATTNSNVTALPEAVLDRFEAVMPAIQPHPDALAQFTDSPMRDAVANHFRSLEASPWGWSGKPTLRRMRAFARLKPVVGEANAASLAFGTAGRELLGVLTTSARGKL